MHLKYIKVSLFEISTRKNELFTIFLFFLDVPVFQFKTSDVSAFRAD